MPFGFRVEAGGLVQDEAEAAAVAGAAEAVLSGVSVLRAAREMALPPRRVESWSDRSLKRLLLNPRVAPALLGEAQAQLLREALEPKSGPSSTNPSRLLSGILRCYSCGGPVHSMPRKDRGGEYRCRARWSGTPRPCDRAPVASANPVDAWIEEDFLAHRGPLPETVAVRLADERVARVSRLAAEIAQRTDALAALPRAERRVALLDLEDLEDERDTLRASRGYALTVLRETGRTLGEAWAGSDLRERRELLRSGLPSGRLTLGPGRIGARAWDPGRIAEADEAGSVFADRV